MTDSDSDPLAGSDLDYLKWAVEQQLGRIDAADEHVKDLHRRATVITGVTGAIVSFAFPLLAPHSWPEVLVLALGVLGTGTCWWRVMHVRRSEDYDPTQFTDAIDEYETRDFVHAILLHMTNVAAAAQVQVGRKGALVARNWAVGGLSILAIIAMLTLGVLGNGNAEDAPAQTPPSEATEGRSQSTGHDPEAERHPMDWDGAHTKGELNGG